MSDFLNHLVARAAGTAEQITPRPASRFEPAGWEPDADFEELAATRRRLVSEPHVPAGPLRKLSPGLPPVVARPERLPAADPLPEPALAVPAAATAPLATIAAEAGPPGHRSAAVDVVEARRVEVTTHRAVVGRPPVEQVTATPAVPARVDAPPVHLELRPDPPSPLVPDRGPATGRRSPGPDPAPSVTPAADRVPRDAGEVRVERGAEAVSVTGPPAPYRVGLAPRLDDVVSRRPAATEPPRQAESHTPVAGPANVEVHIGRIEIRSAATPPPAARKRAERSRVMPLDEYLTRRRGRS
ncbi:hypothetical protein [Actinoplanes sp. DH11]|uniref:hypothetical protein n=1 Tax=Actinoplanes sp. DH11 TaxID=2857011 RepID=UPI001E59A80B|nr:hypothetical protein [Actinoplanes sp. DH11]